MLMLTAQKLLCSWWPGETHKTSLLHRFTHQNWCKTHRIKRKSQKESVCVCDHLVSCSQGPSCRAERCSCPGWCDPRGWAGCRLRLLEQRPAAYWAPGVAVSTWWGEWVRHYVIMLSHCGLCFEAWQMRAILTSFHLTRRCWFQTWCALRGPFFCVQRWRQNT